MMIDSRSPRILTTRDVAIRSNAGVAGFVYVLLAVGAAWFLFLALNSAPAAKQGVYATLALLVAAFMFGWNALVGAVEHRVIRISSEGVLRFTPRRRLAASYLVIACAGVIPGTLSLVGGVGDLGTLRRSPEVLALLSLIWLGLQGWSLRLPTGLTVSPEGLSGVRNGGTIDVTWDQLASATATGGDRGSSLELGLADGGAVAVQGMYVGSDPNLVAAIIEHFRTHPDDRALLADAPEAVRAVELASLQSGG